MFSFSRSRRTILIVLTAATVLLLLRDPLRHALFAFRFAASLKALSVGHSGHPTDVKEASVRRQVGNREYEALVYHPAQRQAATAIVLVAGLSELGCYHPRLVALSRSLAAQGLMIVTPDVREFRSSGYRPGRLIRFCSGKDRCRSFLEGRMWKRPVSRAYRIQERLR